MRHHYDVGNEFFSLFLDRSMTYSCALFSRGATTLEEAQEAKLELVCTKLGLQEGERVLDVGCGWGSFAIHAARHHGVRVLGVTLAERQAELARERVREAGVADRVEIRIADYREVVEDPFDAIVSIGMVEHVGEERIDLYAQRLAGLLVPGGRLLNHGIAKLKDFDTPDEGPFSERFVFPDGVPLPLSRIELALERAGFVTRHVEGLPEDYAETLRHWIERFDRNYERAVQLAGIERGRIWRLYLRAARMGFQTGWASIYQVLAHLPRAMTTQAERAERFLALHTPGEPLLLPNPWDAGSAKLLAAPASKRWPRTSSGFAATLGRLDGSVSRDRGADAMRRRSSRRPSFPVSADLENGFGDDPETVARTIAGAIDAGSGRLLDRGLQRACRRPIYDLRTGRASGLPPPRGRPRGPGSAGAHGSGRELPARPAGSGGHDRPVAGLPGGRRRCPLCARADSRSTRSPRSSARWTVR